jgi:hypothetical protein
MNQAGTIGEAKFSTYLMSIGYEVEKAPARKFYDWDIKATKKSAVITFEVKYDEKAYYWAAKRGTPTEPNIYIEYKNTNRNEDSGILASKSDYYIYILKSENDIAYVFDRAKLCAHLVSSTYKSVGNSATGDDNAIGWIPPLSQIIKHDSYIKQIAM